MEKFQNPINRGSNYSVNIDLIRKEHRKLTEKHPGLLLKIKNDGTYTIRGRMSFSKVYKGKKIDDTYKIEILIPGNYPDEIPKVKEIGGRIDKCPNNHISYDGTLCLGSPIRNQIKFLKEPNLLGLTENLVVPFLFALSYKEEYGKLPYGELSHGEKGLLEDYYSLFKVKDYITVLKFLLYLSGKQGIIKEYCLCGSGKKFKNCHKKQLINLTRKYSCEIFYKDFSLICKYLLLKEEKIPKYLYQCIQFNLLDEMKLIMKGILYTILLFYSFYI